jgi:DNA-binding NarL/FixJ family response regulator
MNDFSIQKDQVTAGVNDAQRLNVRCEHASEDLDTQPGSALLSDLQWNSVGTGLGLSRRELQVCRHLFLGMTRNEIAVKLEIKPRTVRQYMEQIHKKLQATNRVEVVLRIVQIRDVMDSLKGPTANPLSENR